MVDLYGQYLDIKEEVQAGFEEVFKSCWFINGPAVKAFSSELADYLNVSHVTACGNGTDALQIALMALGLKPGDEVITTAFTFVATAEVIALLGLNPVFVEIDERTFNIDANKIEAAITPKTKCIIPVHLYGQSSDMGKIMKIAKRHQLYVVEDNAQAIGADYTFSDGTVRKTGAIGDIGCTSFYPSKNLGAYGDAGAVFSNNPDLGEKIHVMANHGQREKYVSAEVGINSRLDSFQAVVLRAKLKKLDAYIAARQKAADAYDAAFKDHPKLLTPLRALNSTHVFHQYTLTVDGDRDKLRALLQEKGIPSMVYYPIPLHMQEAYKQYGYKAGDLPITERLCNQVISLPMHTELDNEQLNYIIETFLGCLRQI
ncbi:MAG: DegT/DnrJ/EryC1/StrS family aminotransferase [Chitinophagales bacterium]